MYEGREFPVIAVRTIPTYQIGRGNIPAGGISGTGGERVDVIESDGNPQVAISESKVNRESCGGIEGRRRTGPLFRWLGASIFLMSTFVIAHICFHNSIYKGHKASLQLSQNPHECAPRRTENQINIPFLHYSRLHLELPYT